MKELLDLPEGDVSELLEDSVVDDITLLASRINEQIISGELVSSDVLERITQLIKAEEQTSGESLLNKVSPKFIIYLIRYFAEDRYDKYRGSFWDIYDHGMIFFKDDENFDDWVEYGERIKKMPGFHPDEMLRRWLDLEPVFISESSDIPEFITERFEEAKRCFIYGNTLAGIALCRATLEAALKENFSLRDTRMGLSEMVDNLWAKEGKLKKRPELKELAVQIIEKGNDALHDTKRPPSAIGDRAIFIDCWNNLKKVLEYIL